MNTSVRRLAPALAPEPLRPPTAAELEDIARAAVAHKHSVTRRLLRLRVRGGVAKRIDAELVRRGFMMAEEAGQ